MAILNIQIWVNCQAHWYKIRSLQIVSLFLLLLLNPIVLQQPERKNQCDIHLLILQSNMELFLIIIFADSQVKLFYLREVLDFMS